MQRLEFAPAVGRPLRILAIGCHSDDIEIGCGGTILSAIAERDDVEVVWVVLSALGPRRDEAEQGAAAMLEGASHSEVLLGEFPDGYLPYRGEDVKRFFETLTQGPAPDVIFTHQRADLHQDHRLACELTWNTFRDHLILEYEIPKWDGDLGTPNVFVPLARPILDRKLEIVTATFASQRDKGWFTEDLFTGLTRLRGMECRSESGHAEAFFGRKLRLDVGLN